jgi:uncharacterized protein (TIGR02231 family)
LQRKRGEITAGASKTEREAVLFLQKQAAGPAEVRLNYLVNSCGWSPAYTMRSGADRKQVRIEYNALIQQLTGEDWSDVKLTLSTASPALSATGPGLAPFHVTLNSGDDLFGGAATGSNHAANRELLWSRSVEGPGAGSTARSELSSKRVRQSRKQRGDV